MEMIDTALFRIRVEYIEMPDLTLTPAQARRLWHLPREVCDAALATLLSSGFLALTRDGRFLRRGAGTGRAAIPSSGAGPDSTVAPE